MASILSSSSLQQFRLKPLICPLVRPSPQTALSQGKRTLLIHDPDPSSRIHVDLAAARQEAPEDLRPIFDGPCLAWPGFGGDVDGVTRELMELGGFQDWFRPRGHEESQ